MSETQTSLERPSRPPTTTVMLRSSIALFLIPCIAILLEVLSHQHPAAVQLKHSLINASNLFTVLRNPACFPKPPYTLYSTRVLWPDRILAPAYIVIDKHGKIRLVSRLLPPQILTATKVIVDVSPHVVMPGLIDPHVHINEPGRQKWEGFHHATRAAAAGGTTTVLDMPLNNVPSTLNQTHLTQKVQALKSAQPVVDVALIGGITPLNMDQIDKLVAAGVVALKSFMVDSQSADFPHVSQENLETAIHTLHTLATSTYPNAPPIPYMLHAELDLGPHPALANRATYDDKSYSDYEASRPASWEVEAVRAAIRAANNSRVHTYIAHVSAHDILDLISELQSENALQLASLSLETCPHYLVWASDEIPDGATLYKCSPPIRSRANRALLRSTAFRTNPSADVTIDAIGSDHSPCPYDLKDTGGNLTRAWGGISGLQYRLQATWSAAKEEGASIAQVAELLSAGPAHVFGLENLKGSLRGGLDADVVVWDPEGEEQLSEQSCQHRWKASAYHGSVFKGRVMHTLLRGESVFSKEYEGELSKPAECVVGKGRLVKRRPEIGQAYSVILD